MNMSNPISIQTVIFVLTAQTPLEDLNKQQKASLLCILISLVSPVHCVCNAAILFMKRYQWPDFITSVSYFISQHHC